MTTDNRTSEPTEVQVKLAYLAHLKAPRTRGMDVYGPMRAALVAAQGAARPVNGFDTTAERVKTGADSLHVAMQEPCPQPCEHLSAEDARDGRDCREHPCTCPTAPSSDREKLIEEARAVVPQAETPQCGPCRRGQHGCCDGNEYLRCECSHGAAPVPSSGVDEDKLAEVLCRVMDGETYEGEPCSACRQQARAVAEWLRSNPTKSA